MTQQDTIDALREIDESDSVDVTPWESEFMDSVFTQHKNEQTLSAKQLKVCQTIIEKYEGKL